MDIYPNTQRSMTCITNVDSLDYSLLLLSGCCL